MKFFKNFFKFQKDLNLSEQNKPNVAQDVDRVVGGMGEEKLDTKAKGKNRLDYSKKAKETEEMWKGKNYDTQWKPFVDDNLNDPKTFDKVVDFLKNYQGQKNAPVIKKILTDAEKKEKAGQGSVKDRVKELATDGRPGPFHTAVLQAIKKATDKVEPLEPKQAKIQVKDEVEKKVKGVPVDPERTKQYVDKIETRQQGKIDTTGDKLPEPVVTPKDVPKSSEVVNKKMIIKVIDRETKKPILTAEYILKDEDGEVLSSARVDENAEFSFMIIGTSEFNVNISADGYETFDKKLSYGDKGVDILTGEKDEILNDTKENEIRKTVSLKPIKKVEPEPEKKPEKPKEEPKIYTGDEDKSETSDQKTGNVGEKEKVEMEYNVTGKNSSEQLLNLKYPVNMKEEVDLGKVSFTNNTFVAGKKNVLNIEFSDKEAGTRFIYYIGPSGNKKYPVQMFSFRVESGEGLKFGYTPKNEGEYKLKIIISTVKINQKYYKVNGIKMMSDDQCKEFLDNLLKERKPFSEVKSGKPVFQTVDKIVKVNPK